MKRFISWAAVSSLPQAKKISLDDQLATNREHIEKHAGHLVAELVVPGESRNIVLFEDACARIEAYAKLRDLIEQRAFDVLIYLDRSRLGRKASLSMAVVELCHSAGIQTYETESPPSSLDDPIATHDDMLLGAIKSVGAQREIMKLQERHLAGMKARVRAGKFPGPVPFGWRTVYDQQGNKRIEIDDQAARIIRHALLDLYLARNMPISLIAQELHALGYKPPINDKWNRYSVYNLIKRIDRYAGWGELNKLSPSNRTYLRARGAWPPIITEEELQALKKERLSRAESRRAVNSYLLSRACNCGYCSARIVAHQREVVSMNYRCREMCKGAYVREQIVVEALEDAIDALSDPQFKAQVLGAMPDPTREISAEQNNLAEELERITEARGRLTKAYVDLGAIDAGEYQGHMQQHAKRREIIERRQDDLHSQLEDIQDDLGRAERLEDIITNGHTILHGDVQQANVWIRNRFRIWIRKNRVCEIKYV